MTETITDLIKNQTFLDTSSDPLSKDQVSKLESISEVTSDKPSEATPEGTSEVISTNTNAEPQYHLAMFVSYAGHKYAGFQRQHHATTVQGCLEAAISKIASEPVETNCAGRTDAGVHGTNQVISFSTKAKRTTYGWLMGVNSQLPPDIRVTKVVEVDEQFHARFSARARRYRYLIKDNCKRIYDAHLHQLVTFIDQELDVEKMNQACRYLIGEQNFKSFQAARCQASTPNRNIIHAYFRRYADLIVFDIKANAFLYHMVRNIMGTMLEVGMGKIPPQHLQTIIASQNRQLAPATAPADGLYLVEVDYPEYAQLQADKLGPLYLPNEIN